jgi:hypothetical protein
MEKQPATVPDAECIWEEFEAREKMGPVSTKFAAAMASANPPTSVDNVNTIVAEADTTGLSIVAKAIVAVKAEAEEKDERGRTRRGKRCATDARNQVTSLNTVLLLPPQYLLHSSRTVKGSSSSSRAPIRLARPPGRF